MKASKIIQFIDFSNLTRNTVADMNTFFRVCKIECQM